MIDHTQTTAGQALWNLDRPLADFPNRKPWEQLSDHAREQYEFRAATILDTADAIRAAMKVSRA